MGEGKGDEEGVKQAGVRLFQDTHHCPVNLRGRSLLTGPNTPTWGVGEGGRGGGGGSEGGEGWGTGGRATGGGGRKGDGREGDRGWQNLRCSLGRQAKAGSCHRLKRWQKKGKTFNQQEDNTPWVVDSGRQLQHAPKMRQLLCVPVDLSPKHKQPHRIPRGSLSCINRHLKLVPSGFT